MAYSLTDHYRPLRTALRVNGTITGWGLGLLLTVLPRTMLTAWGVVTSGPIWPLRLAGVSLIALGVLMLAAASERIIVLSVLLTTLVANGLIAVVLLVAYLQRDLSHLFLPGQLLLVVVVFLSLICALLALRYLRNDYARD